MKTRLLFGALLLAGVGPSLEAQSPRCAFRGAPDALDARQSPLDSVLIRLGDETAKLCYGRPSTHGRTMVGGEDPYGLPWRLGANEPTTLHLPFPAMVGSLALDPGSYSLYAIPEPARWTIVVNENTHRWGIPIGPEVRRFDVGSFTVQTRPLSPPAETMTFRFQGSGPSGRLVYEWEGTTFDIPIARR
ncbi:MAG: DUF2911 domain-containing protein [Longimicrobiales bacterium]|nr:DUF2911 domain-containing protein [Longimicrobiales bacterium]